MPSAQRNDSTIWCRSRLRSASDFPAVGQKHAAIAPLLDKPVGGQPLEHLGDGRLGHAKALGDVDLPRLAVMVDQVGDQFDIVLDKFAAPVAARLAEALDLRVGVNQATELSPESAFRSTASSRALPAYEIIAEAIGHCSATIHPAGAIHRA